MLITPDIWPERIAEARSYGLEFDRNCPTPAMVGGAILDADVDWKDWYNDGKKNITVLGAISYVMSKRGEADDCVSTTYNQAALIAYIEFHRWKKRQDDDTTLWFRPELLKEVEKAKSLLMDTREKLDGVIAAHLHVNLHDVAETLERVQEVLNGRKDNP
jgi:hypothetical protein